MKTLLAAALLTVAASGTAHADDIGWNEIHEQLDPYGDWMTMAGYGEVWRPRDVDMDWRPYTVGRWERSGEDWLWLSDFVWGSVPFHYGRWLEHAQFGWVWVPGFTYAPHWVVWGEDRSYTTWAPLPPGPCWRGDLFIGAVRASSWVYLPTVRFRDRYVRADPHRWRGIPRRRIRIARAQNRWRSVHGSPPRSVGRGPVVHRGWRDRVGPIRKPARSDRVAPIRKPARSDRVAPVRKPARSNRVAPVRKQARSNRVAPVRKQARPARFSPRSTSGAKIRSGPRSSRHYQKSKTPRVRYRESTSRPNRVRPASRSGSRRIQRGSAPSRVKRSRSTFKPARSGAKGRSVGKTRRR